MTTVAVVRMGSDQMGCAETFSSVPGVRFKFEKAVFGDDDPVRVWVTGPDESTVREALTDDTSVRTVEEVETGDDEWLFELSFDCRQTAFREALREYDATILEGYGSDGEWTISVRFPDRDQFARAYESLDGRGIEATLVSVHDTADGPHSRCGLTKGQYEALKRAIETGYYDVPRGTTLEELAKEFGLSHQALSEQLRRAEREALTSALARQIPPKKPLPE